MSAVHGDCFAFGGGDFNMTSGDNGVGAFVYVVKSSASDKGGAAVIETAYAIIIAG